MPEIKIVSDYSITQALAARCHEFGDSIIHGGLGVEQQVYKNKMYGAPDFCFVFCDKATNEPVGYFIIIPLTTDAVLRYMDNKLSCATISPDDLEELEDDQMFTLFFDSMVLHPNYQTPKMAKLAFALLADALVESVRSGFPIATIF